jgi:two-component system, cell cycle response regulator
MSTSERTPSPTGENGAFPWRLLLVEDEPTQLRMLARRLTKAGYCVETATDGQSALEKLRSGGIHMLITDWDMEPMDGATLCRLVREGAKLDSYLYIIMLTGHNAVSDVVAGFEAGADDYLRKPADEAELLARLKAGRRILELEQQVQRLSIMDPLIETYNRRYLDVQLPRDIERAHRYHLPLSVVLADLDYFKRINDEHGHQAGDKVLRCFAERARGSLRQSDWFARYGGEEFVFVLADTKLPGAMEVAEKIRAQFELAILEAASVPLRVTASFGVAELASEDASAEGLDSLLRRADNALYDAKRCGRNCVRTLDAEAKSDSDILTGVDSSFAA